MTFTYTEQDVAMGSVWVEFDDETDEIVNIITARWDKRPENSENTTWRPLDSQAKPTIFWEAQGKPSVTIEVGKFGAWKVCS